MQLITITFQLLAQLNFVAVLVASVGMFVLGFVWYGPLFGTLWSRYIGPMKQVSQKEMIPAYVLTFIGGFIEATFLLFFTLLLQTQFWHTALLVWVGFIVFNAMSPVLWEQKSWKLFVLNAGHRLINLLVAGAILSLFF